MVAGRAGHRPATRPQGEERLAECPPDAGRRDTRAATPAARTGAVLARVHDRAGLALLKMLRPRGRAAALTATYAARRTATRRRAGRRWPRSSSESRQRRVNRAETITMASSGTSYG